MILDNHTNSGGQFSAAASILQPRAAAKPGRVAAALPTQASALLHTLTPTECIEILSTICVNRPRMTTDDCECAVVEVELPFGCLSVRSDAGYWADDFQSETLVCSIRFADLIYNDPKGLTEINRELTDCVAQMVQGTLILVRKAYLRNGRTKSNLLWEISGLYIAAEKVWAKLSAI